MNKKLRSLTVVLFASLFMAGAFTALCHEGVPVDPAITEDSPREHSKLYLERKDLPWTQLEDGIAFQEIRQGKGIRPYKDALVYVMWRMFDMEDGKEIYYRTKHRTDNFFYDQLVGKAMGGGGTLRAVELAMKDMREGGKRLISVSSEKAFGKEGWSDSHFVVPPDTDVVIELSLLWVRDPDPKRFTSGRPHPRPYQVSAARKEDGPADSGKNVASQKIQASE